MKIDVRVDMEDHATISNAIDLLNDILRYSEELKLSNAAIHTVDTAINDLYRIHEVLRQCRVDAEKDE